MPPLCLFPANSSAKNAVGTAGGKADSGRGGMVPNITTARGLYTARNGDTHLPLPSHLLLPPPTVRRHPRGEGHERHRV